MCLYHPRVFMYKNRDVQLLFATRIARLFGYGFLSVVLLLYLAAAGLSDDAIGLLLTLTMFGDTVVSLGITTTADRIGRKTMLIAGAVLVIFAGVLFAVTTNFLLLLIAATIGVISPSGSEVGPFLSIEQAALSEIVDSGDRRIRILTWYNLVGSFATACGALAGGKLAQSLQDAGMSPFSSYRVLVVGYAAVGVLLSFLFIWLSPAVESAHLRTRATDYCAEEATKDPPPGRRSRVWRVYEALGLPRSGPVVARLAALFSMDAFAGGFVLQSIVAYWFHVRYGVEPGTLGSIFFGANILAGISAFSAGWLARRIGLIRTMVFTHIPSNVLLILVPLMPNLRLSIAMWLFRLSISQMDVPTRQAYTISVVDAHERSAAGGVTGVARSAGSSLAPAIAGKMLAASMLSLPFFVAGGLKIVYDILLYRNFHASQGQKMS